MNTRRLILAGGTVAFAALGVVKRNRRSSRPRTRGSGVGVTVAIPLLGGVVFALPNMPDLGAIFLKFWNLGNLIWDQISNIVLGILEEAWQLLEEAVDAALNVVDQTFEAVIGSIDYFAGKINNVANAVGGVIADTYDMLDGAFANFRQQLKSWFETVWGQIEDFILETIPDLIGGIAGDALDFLKALMELGTDGLAFLLNLVDDPINFLWQLLEDTVKSAFDVWMSGLGDLFDALVKIMDLIVWLGEHVDDFTVDALETILNPSWQSIQKDIVDAVDENIDSFESLVRKIFGL